MRLLTDDARIEKNPPEMVRFATHLPVFDLQVVSRWGAMAYEHVVDEVGWVGLRITPGTPLPRWWFVSRIEGHGLDDGVNGFRDGALALFDASPREALPGIPFLIRGSFTDPELGAYTVRLISRIGEGRIVLTSLNPDRSQFPDILVDASHADSVHLVARVVQPLLSQYRPLDSR